MFIDKVDIYIKAGDGGNGAVSFHREKYVSHGGPDGGDGGHGGSIVFRVDSGDNTLLKFKYRRKFVAQNGEDGKPGKFHGKTAADTVIMLPPGTVIRDKQTGKVIFDMGADREFVAAKGGRGGWGNSHFATPTRQIPRFAKAGTKGDERELTLELKMLADVGLIGFPNVGKSSLLSAVSAARPKIANYHFTTLSPMLGVVSTGEGSGFVMADIPGLIEGAGDGIGLGHDFLRHVDRCRLFVHVVDAAGSEGRDPIEDIRIINNELFKYNPELKERRQIVAANKIDLGLDDEIKERLEAYCREAGYDLVFISAASTEGTKQLIRLVSERLKDTPPMKEYEPEYVEEEKKPLDRTVKVTNINGVYNVECEALEALVEKVNFDDDESFNFFQRNLKTLGVIDALEKAGVNDGDTVSLYGLEFDFWY